MKSHGDAIVGSSRVPYMMSTLVENRDRRVVDLSPMGFPEIPVLGMNRVVCANKGAALHRHRRCLEITVCLRGNAKFDCDGRVHVLTPGTAFISRPEDAHRLRMNQKGTRLFWMFLRQPKARESVLGLPYAESSCLIDRLRELACRPFPVGEDVGLSFAEMFAAYDDAALRPGVRSLGLRVAASRLLLSIARGCDGVCGEDERVFGAIVSQMRRNPQDEYGEEWLVKRTGYSPNTVLSRFRKLTGLPPHAFLVKCRIHRAKELLRLEDWTVTRIASELRFASSQHFATCFRQEVGVTPTEWRSVHKNAK